MKQILLLATAFASFTTFGQTNIRFSQFNVGKSIINPAATGAEAKISAELLYRTQWTGQKGAPSTVGFNGNYEINSSHAVGLTLVNDQVGIAKSTEIRASYAYRIYINDEQNFAFGANVGVQNVVNDYAKVFTIHQNDPSFAQSYNKWAFNAGFGMYYNGPYMYLGYAIPSLMNNVHFGPEKGFKPKMWHHYLSAGFYIANRDGSYIFNPIVQAKFVPDAPFQADLTLRNIFYGRYAFSIGYRSENALSTGFDIMIANNARIGYNFNYNLGRYAGFRATSHEIYLGLGLPFYYETNRFAKRKFMNNKSTFSKEYKQRARKLNKRRNFFD